MKVRTEILASGFGGQGVVRLGQIIGEAAVKEGYRVTIKYLSVENFGRPVFANTIMLGAISRHLDVLDREIVLESILHVIPKFHEENKRAFEIGYSLFNDKK